MHATMVMGDELNYSAVDREIALNQLHAMR